MFFCNECPFEGISPSNLGSAGCKFMHGHNQPPSPHRRCHADMYVIKNLSNNDPIAANLFENTFKSALQTRDRSLLTSLFRSANKHLKQKLWALLKENEPRSLWLLNPIFSAQGLDELTSINDAKESQNSYIDAISDCFNVSA